MSSALPVSVIIPCYRCTETIGRAVDSVLNQTQVPEEIILVDDFSDDGSSTLSSLKKLKQKHKKFNIKILELEKNQGPGSARNESWKVATQPYIAFLDADDSWHPKKLELQYSWMKCHPEVLLTAHDSIQAPDSTHQKVLNSLENFYPINVVKFLFFNCIPTRSVMLKRDINYRFLSGKRYAEDYLLWLSIVLDNNPIYFSNLPLSYSYKNEFGDAGLTADLSKAHAGLVETYQQLFKDQRILWPTCIVLVAFAYVKYLRRLLVVGCRKLLSVSRRQS
jgi:glycosyltransferase involved in cell wall biosynthesis